MCIELSVMSEELLTVRQHVVSLTVCHLVDGPSRYSDRDDLNQNQN